jgi:UDP-N-acetylglucosamine--N-acetylmuramyl-(pentapeptide) pyrophosphoryl-undecaprenol N-acetylglucosamine transferase
VVPALAVAAALRAEADPPPRIVFIGGDRAERDLVPEAGFELRTITVEGLSRSNPLKALRSLGKAASAVRAAGAILDELRPAAVLGAGGYVAGPVGLAAARRGIPLVLAEADSHLGLTNRLLARRARRVCLAFEIDGRQGSRYRVTGRPVPAQPTDRAAARTRFGLGEGDTVVLVFGGSLGARSINEAAVSAWGGADPGFRVLHTAGERDLAALRTRLGDPPPAWYDLRGFIGDFGEALLACDLVVARSGGSIFEVAAAGRPAILVPYPHAAADHQAENARWMERAGAAIVIDDSGVTAERLAREVSGLLGDAERLSTMAAASKGLARPGAAADIAGELRAAAAGS